MKKKIAFLGEPWHGAMIRLESFMKVNPQYDFSFVNCNEQMNQNNLKGFPDHPFEFQPTCTFTSSFFHNFNPDEYYSIFVLNDKFFDKLITVKKSKCLNLTNKKILEQEVERFGLGKIKSTNFDDDDIVFVKPILGAGQYAPDNISYRKFRYSDIKELLNPNFHIVQDYIDEPIVTFVNSIVSPDGEIDIIDVSQAYHSFDTKEQSLNCHLESKFSIIDQFAEHISITKEFLKSTNLISIPSVYMLQFARYYGNLIITDFNVRTGPIADIVTAYGYYKHKIQSNLSFMVESTPIVNDVVYPRFRCYLEKDGIVISPLIENRDFANRILLDGGNKTSGLIRSDYETYLEIINGAI